MALKDYNVLREYRNKSKDIISEFYLPLMSESVLYQRAVGYFSSSALSYYSVGITKLIENGGVIELIATPELSEDDVEAIRLGYQYRDDVIENALINALYNPINNFEEERLNLLATYIADRKLDLKIAFVENGGYLGIYHEKLGLLYDNEDNCVAFSGSMNESGNGFYGNYETVDAYCSWKEADKDRVDDKIDAFSAIWNDRDVGVTTISFPNVKQAIIDKYKKRNINYTIDEDEFGIEFNKQENQIKQEKKEAISISDNTLYNYQKKAIDKWEEQGFRGIFDMCTGAGKTYTAIGAIKRLYNYNKREIAVIIVVPYQHLVEQWVEDLEKFNIDPIIGYSAGKYKNYRKLLRQQIFDYNLGVKKFICFICTNDSFKNDEVQSIIRKVNKDILLVVDEAHNFGSNELRKHLLERYNYRLALSATIDRHGDAEGTNALYDFFGNKCITYTLDEAIREKKLTEYWYRPYLVTLTQGELSDYTSITLEMKQYMHKDKQGKIVLTDRAKKLAIKRARIVAGAYEKSQKLKELIEPYKDEHNLLVYCGATNMNSEALEDEGVDEDIRQIDYITSMLGEDLGMNVAQFTSKEDMETRTNLINRYKRARELQGLIAIKCLDEGVNIPSIKTAFILASTTNPKEYIQRRGRVLRTYPGKKYAEIYDFITLPRPLDEINSMPEEEIKLDISLVKNEINRMIEFKKSSLNPYDSDSIIDSIIDAYELDLQDGFMDIEEYHFE